MRLPLLAIVCLFFFSFQAQAHPGHAGPHGLADGLAHPFSGLDHVIAMLAVGLWAAQLGGRSIWVVPSAFAGAMALGAALSWLGVPLPLVQAGILASAIVFGLALATAARWPWWACAALVGGFAVFHGYAHGAAALQTSSALVYGAGLVLATALLHLTGIAVGLVIRRSDKAIALRYAGACVVLIGVCHWLVS